MRQASSVGRKCSNTKARDSIPGKQAPTGSAGRSELGPSGAGSQPRLGDPHGCCTTRVGHCPRPRRARKVRVNQSSPQPAVYFLRLLMLEASCRGLGFSTKVRSPVLLVYPILRSPTPGPCGLAFPGK